MASFAAEEAVDVIVVEFVLPLSCLSFSFVVVVALAFPAVVVALLRLAVVSVLLVMLLVVVLAFVSFAFVGVVLSFSLLDVVDILDGCDVSIFRHPR